MDVPATSCAPATRADLVPLCGTGTAVHDKAAAPAAPYPCRRFDWSPPCCRRRRGRGSPPRQTVCMMERWPQGPRRLRGTPRLIWGRPGEPTHAPRRPMCPRQGRPARSPALVWGVGPPWTTGTPASPRGLWACRMSVSHLLQSNNLQKASAALLSCTGYLLHLLWSPELMLAWLTALSTCRRLLGQLSSAWHACLTCTAWGARHAEAPSPLALQATPALPTQPCSASASPQGWLSCWAPTWRRCPLQLPGPPCRGPSTARSCWSASAACLQGAGSQRWQPAPLLRRPLLPLRGLRPRRLPWRPLGWRQSSGG